MPTRGRIPRGSGEYPPEPVLRLLQQRLGSGGSEDLLNPDSAGVAMAMPWVAEVINPLFLSGGGRSHALFQSPSQGLLRHCPRAKPMLAKPRNLERTTESADSTTNMAKNTMTAPAAMMFASNNKLATEAKNALPKLMTVPMQVRSRSKPLCVLGNTYVSIM